MDLKGIRKTSCGFTLLELIVVLFIVSVVMAVVLPSFSTTSSGLKADARRVASILRHLNETAVLKKKTLHLKFDLAEKTLTWPDRGGERTESISSMRIVELQTKGGVSEGELTVFFSPLGLSEHLNIYLSRGDEDMTVAMSPVSGRVKILNGKER